MERRFRTRSAATSRCCLGKRCGSAGALQDAAESRKVPLKVLDLSEPEIARAYENFAYVLIRPDQRLAWRGHELPKDSFALTDRIRGA